VGVAVAAQADLALAHAKMFLILGIVAHTALGYSGLSQGEMLKVTVKTGHLGFVLSTICLNGRWLTIVALGTVCILEFGLFLILDELLFHGGHTLLLGAVAHCLILTALRLMGGAGKKSRRYHENK